MVTLPKDFVATRYPGYFWHVVERKLYTIKVTGELRPMAFNKGGHFYGVVHQPGYQISVKGHKRKLTMEYLGTLKPVDGIQEIPALKG
jgi:hypothetical protein